MTLIKDYTAEDLQNAFDKGRATGRAERDWVGLTDEEFTRIQQETPYTESMTVSQYALQCQIKHEAKLKEKNHGA